MTGLNADNLKTWVNKDGEVIVEPSYVKYLRENGYNIEAIGALHSVPSKSSDGAHIVQEIQTYQYPRNHPKLDVAQHSTEIWVCDCWDYRSNQSVDVAETPLAEGSLGSCKHIRAVSKIANAKADDQQETL
jgi:hypothetical protein